MNKNMFLNELVKLNRYRQHLYATLILSGFESNSIQLNDEIWHCSKHGSGFIFINDRKNITVDIEDVQNIDFINEWEAYLYFSSLKMKYVKSIFEDVKDLDIKVFEAMMVLEKEGLLISNDKGFQLITNQCVVEDSKKEPS